MNCDVSNSDIEFLSEEQITEIDHNSVLFLIVAVSHTHTHTHTHVCIRSHTGTINAEPHSHMIIIVNNDVSAYYYIRLTSFRHSTLVFTQSFSVPLSFLPKALHYR